MNNKEHAPTSVGMRYGKLTVVEDLPNRNRRAWVRAACDCGKEWVGKLNALRSGNTHSCGCQLRKFEDLSGKRFGRWTVVACAQKRGKRSDGSQMSTLFLCQCDCGNTGTVQAGALKNGLSKSCGCEPVEAKRSTSKYYRKTYPAEYTVWSGMKGRVTNPRNKDFSNYGGRGIAICDAWSKDFMSFYKDMGARPTAEHSIERKENDGDYTPENCYWATREIQANNNRGNRPVTVGDETKTLAQWCRLYDRDYAIVYQRVKYSGWTPECALACPTVNSYEEGRAAERTRRQRSKQKEVEPL